MSSQVRRTAQVGQSLVRVSLVSLTLSGLELGDGDRHLVSESS